MNKEKLYKIIDTHGIGSKEALKASQELDEVILAEMIKMNPANEIIHLQQKLIAKDCEIDKLKNRILELSKIVEMYNEAGESKLIDSIIAASVIKSISGIDKKIIKVMG